MQIFQYFLSKKRRQTHRILENKEIVSALDYKKKHKCIFQQL